MCATYGGEARRKMASERRSSATVPKRVFGFEYGGWICIITPMVDDGELLRQYVKNRSEKAFADLVQRHLNLVYSAAARRLGGARHRAEDISQSVFVDLARKAPALLDRASLAGWLYIATQRATAHLLRAEQRRLAREEKAQIMQEIVSAEGSAVDWEQVRPVLDDALRRLSERDREAILLRFFEGCSFADVGAKLRLSQDAARMRVERALEKLRGHLGRHGVASSGAALAAILANQAVTAAPGGLAAAISASAVAGVSGAGVVPVLIQLMNLTKLQIGIGAIAIAAGGIAGFHEHRANQNLRTRIAALRQENSSLPGLRADHIRLQRFQADLVAATEEADFNAKFAEAGKTVVRPTQQSFGQPIDSLASALAGGPLFDEKSIDQKPVAIDQANPVYPSELKKLGVEGRVVVDFVVAADGGVVDAHAVSFTNSGFADAAVKAVSEWVFKPGQKTGRSVNTRMNALITFSVKK